LDHRFEIADPLSCKEWCKNSTARAVSVVAQGTEARSLSIVSLSALHLLIVACLTSQS
jgi:hypothetical protein